MICIATLTLIKKNKMGKIKSTIKINKEVDGIYKYLKERYNSERFKKVSIDTKGYVPKIVLTEDEINSKLVFTAKGHDPLTKMKIGGWEWGYKLKKIQEKQTEISLYYEWNSIMSFLSLWTIKHQAANELTETVMALDALEQS